MKIPAIIIMVLVVLLIATLAYNYISEWPIWGKLLSEVTFGEFFLAGIVLAGLLSSGRR